MDESETIRYRFESTPRVCTFHKYYTPQDNLLDSNHTPRAYFGIYKTILNVIEENQMTE